MQQANKYASDVQSFARAPNTISELSQTRSSHDPQPLCASGSIVLLSRYRFWPLSVRGVHDKSSRTTNAEPGSTPRGHASLAGTGATTRGVEGNMRRGAAGHKSAVSVTLPPP